MSAATEAAPGAPADAVASKADERRAIGVASGAHALHDGYTDLIYVMLPLWQADFGIGFAALGTVRARFGWLTGAFLVGYGIARIIGEFFRQPDVFLGYLLAGATMGQLLSIPMVIAGVWLILRTR